MQIQLMNQARIERTLRRIAIQVWERLGQDDELVVIGLNERGFATAKELADNLEGLTGHEVEVSRYDVSGDGSSKKLPECNDKFVLLVDDVIFSGKTMFVALSDICSIYEPGVIEIAVLIDRGHRKYPLLTGMPGIQLPTKMGEHIEVMLEDSKLKEAILFKNNK